MFAQSCCVRTKPASTCKNFTALISCGFRRSSELGGVLTRVAVVFSPHVELLVTHLRRAATKRALRESAEKIAAIEEKLNAILEKLK